MSTGLVPTISFEKNEYWFLAGGIVGLVFFLHTILGEYRDRYEHFVALGNLFQLTVVFWVLFGISKYAWNQSFMYALSFFFLGISVFVLAYVFAGSKERKYVEYKGI
jgi:hypothetical protein